MGLDMYAYKATRLTDEEVNSLKGLAAKDIRQVNEAFSAFTVHDDEDRAHLAELMPYCSVIMLQHEYLDMKKLREDNAIPEEARVVRRISTMISETFGFCAPDGFDKDIPLDAAAIKHYTLKEMENSLVVKMSEVGYWRKDYDLSRMLCSAKRKLVENCGYYKCNKRMLQLMARRGGVPEPELVCGDGEAIFYHEWY